MLCFLLKGSQLGLHGDVKVLLTVGNHTSHASGCLQALLYLLHLRLKVRKRFLNLS